MTSFRHELCGPARPFYRCTTVAASAAVLLFLAACQTTKQEPALHDYVAPLDPPGTHVFLGKAQPAIHIGDDQGNIQDVRNYREIHSDTRFVGVGYTWPFTLEELPTRGTVALNVHSLTLPYGETEYNCPTVLLVNGQEVADLREAAGKQESQGDALAIDIPAERFSLGRNSLTVQEKVCWGSRTSRGRYLNDSIITGVVMRLR